MRRGIASFSGTATEFREWLEWRLIVGVEVAGQLGRPVADDVVVRARQLLDEKLPAGDGWRSSEKDVR